MTVEIPYLCKFMCKKMIEKYDKIMDGVEKLSLFVAKSTFKWIDAFVNH